MIQPPIKPVIRDKAVRGDNQQILKPPDILEKVNSLFSNTPTFSASIYDGLPLILKEGCSVFSDQREQDIFLLSSIVILSGCMPSVVGVYDGAEVRANLFAFVVAPAGSGKGVLSWSRMLGLGFHNHLREESDRLKSEYEQRAAEARSEKQIFLDLPPPQKCLFIPGNSSSSAIIKSLRDNDGNGVICETEADSMTGAINQDWGDFSDTLRKSFHQEIVSLSRKSGECYEITNPALSVMLAGTPGQVSKLIPDAENGLFSRFLFYRFERVPLWRDVSPISGRPSLNKHFGGLSDQVKDMAVCLADAKRVEFSLTDSQWRVLNQFGRSWLERSIEDTNSSISSTIYRLGLIVYRISLVLCVLRCYESRTISVNSIVCDDGSFATALDLAKMLLEHSKLMFSTMHTAGGNSVKINSRQKFLSAVPNQFTREEADSVGRAMSVTERTVTNYLERLVTDGQVLKTRHGMYQKL